MIARSGCFRRFGFSFIQSRIAKSQNLPKPFPQSRTTAVTYFRHSGLLFSYFGGILSRMSSRQVACGLFLAAGVAILALLIMPAVHLPFIVVHGPVSALRAQRSASLLRFMVQAAAFLLAGLLPLPSSPAIVKFCLPKPNSFARMSPNLALRC
jgi:hypothetical protein